MTNQKITFIGAGNMAFSLIGGLLKKGFMPSQINATDPFAPSREKVASLGINTGDDNSAAIANADVVVLAVKPQVMQHVLTPLREGLAIKQPLLISIAAGIDINSLSTWAGLLPIVRCMPNTPALLQLGASGLYANSRVSETQQQLADTILAAVGTTIWLPNEADLDSVTAVSGSGPAYFFLLMEAMQAAGEKLGLDSKTAKQLTLQTALGAATMAIDSEFEPAELRRRVTSPGGTTAEAIKIFESAGFGAIVEAAMVACARHSQTLSQQLGA